MSLFQTNIIIVYSTYFVVLLVGYIIGACSWQHFMTVCFRTIESLLSNRSKLYEWRAESVIST